MICRDITQESQPLSSSQPILPLIWAIDSALSRFRLFSRRSEQARDKAKSGERGPLSATLIRTYAVQRDARRYWITSKLLEYSRKKELIPETKKPGNRKKVELLTLM